MGTGKHSESQIIVVPKQVVAGRRVEGVAPECAVSEHTSYAWESTYGGMDVSEPQEVKQLREKNARLKKPVADLSLDKDIVHSVIRKVLFGIAARRAEGARLIEEVRPVSATSAGRWRFRVLVTGINRGVMTAD